MFALVDCNNFYVSCECAFDPHLQGRPVVVLSNNDGCAVARSNEVKALGVKMGAPWFQLKDLARKHGIIALSSNSTLYGQMSSRVMAVLSDYSPDLEVYSIDESFLGLNGLSGLWPSFTALGQHIRQRVLQWTALPVCVGIAPTKTLAKLANHIAKKQPVFDGVCDLSALPRRDREQLFAQIDVGEVWGVGRRVGARLLAAGIDNVQALRMAPPKWIRAEFGVVMERTVNELRGIACLALEDIAPTKKEMVVSRSFGQMVETFDELAESVTLYVSRAAEKLRAQQSIAGVVQVFVMTNRFRETDAQYSNAIAVPLIAPSSDTRVLTQAALLGLHRIFRSGYRYKKAGVMLMELSPSTYFQGSLFDAPGDTVDLAQSTHIMHTLDTINDRFGRASLFLGSAGVATRWTARSDNRSPRYTTQWDELPRTNN